jgi:type I restriction enzyme S subunit
MSSEWQEGKLGDFITLQRGFDLPARIRSPGTVPVVSSSGISDFQSQAQAKAPGVVTGRYGTIGEVFYIETDYWPLNTTLWVNDFKGNHPRFVYYLLRTVDFQSCSDKSGVPGVNRNDLHDLPVSIPQPREQREIARVLGTLDDKIELNRRMNHTLEGLARAVFRSWFVDFDPVVAKAAGRRPVGIGAATAALFPKSFVDSPLGPIPKGWEIRPIRELVENVFDGPHATPPEASEGAVFLGIKNLTGTQLDLSELRYIGDADWPRWTRRVTPRQGDIVFSYEAALGLFALIPSDLRCCLGRRLALVRLRKDEFHPAFMFHAFTAEPFQELLEARTVPGSTVDRIPLLDFPNFPLLCPGPKLREHYERLASPLWERIHRNQTQNQTLARLRNALLPRLLSGELRLREAERLVGAVA